MNLPEGFFCDGWFAGIKSGPEKKDFGFLFSENVANASAVFTKNKFVGNPVIVGREHIKNGKLQCVIVNSGNSNVGTGKEGLELAYNSCKWTAKALRIKPEDVLPSSTGVIGRKLDPKVLQKACEDTKHHLHQNPGNFAEAILTTDKYPKTYFIATDNYRIAGFAKGAGMIHPQMATMLAYIITDAEISSSDLKKITSFVAGKTFNRISVDSDTSTSDTFVILANGKSKCKVQYPAPEWKKLLNLDQKVSLLLHNYAGSGDEKLFQQIKKQAWKTIGLSEESKDFLLHILLTAMQLAKSIVADGEGATKIFRVNILNAPNPKVAEKIGRSLINSPLIKSAIFGGDPNWGRFLMGIGKVIDEKFDISRIKIYCNGYEFYPGNPDLKMLAELFQKKEIYFDVDLKQGDAFDSFWGCDLTYDYVKINSEYTT